MILEKRQRKRGRNIATQKKNQRNFLRLFGTGDERRSQRTPLFSKLGLANAGPSSSIVGALAWVGVAFNLLSFVRNDSYFVREKKGTRWRDDQLKFLFCGNPRGGTVPRRTSGMKEAYFSTNNARSRLPRTLMRCILK